MQQFDLSLWLQNKSRKIVTRDGREVDIYYSPTSRIPLIGRTSDNEIHQYTENGFQNEMMNQAKNDIFFADEEKELTEFEKELEMMMVSFSNGNLGSDVRKEMPKPKLHSYAHRLLDLARKELEKEIGDKCWEAHLKGEEDALKDLPKWKKMPIFKTIKL